jgi:hypothetical protein
VNEIECVKEYLNIKERHHKKTTDVKSGRSYFADLRMTFRQNFFLQDWFRNKLGVGLEMVFGIGLELVKPLLGHVLSI